MAHVRVLKGPAIALMPVLILFGSVVHPGPVQSEWSVTMDGKVSYTDDVFQFSAVRRLRFTEDPSLPTVVPLDKAEDVVWEPSVEVIRSTLSRLGPTEISVKAHGFLYTDHPIFNHGDYRIQLKQALAPSTSLLLRYRYIPDLFLGPNFERRSGNRLIEEEQVTSHPLENGTRPAPLEGLDHWACEPLRLPVLQ